MSGRGALAPSAASSSRGALGSQAARRRAASVRPLNKEHGQGTHAVPGIGFARLRPARRRLCRQGANSVAGPGVQRFRALAGRQLPVRHLVRSACLSPKHTSPSVSGRQPGAPPAHPKLNRLRVSAGGEDTCPVIAKHRERKTNHVSTQTSPSISAKSTDRTAPKKFSTSHHGQVDCAPRIFTGLPRSQAKDRMGRGAQSADQ